MISVVGPSCVHGYRLVGLLVLVQGAQRLTLLPNSSVAPVRALGFCEVARTRHNTSPTLRLCQARDMSTEPDF